MIKRFLKKLKSSHSDENVTNRKNNWKVILSKTFNPNKLNFLMKGQQKVNKMYEICKMEGNVSLSLMLPGNRFNCCKDKRHQPADNRV